MVVVVALAIEGLVATFKALHQDPSQLRYAAALLASAALLLAAWGLFVHLNRSAEELEPEAMADAKREEPAEPPLPVLISPRPRLPPSSIAAKHLLRILLYRIWRHGALIEQAVLQAEIAAVRRRPLNQMAAHSPAWVHFFVA